MGCVTSDLLRDYAGDELGRDGYPLEWAAIKDMIRAQAGRRCERCHHPYQPGEHGNGKWSPCDHQCDHGGPWRHVDGKIGALWRILTVHHLNGNKADCRWWNLAALCQRCHLTIQGRVILERAFILEHSEWFRPHAAGWYALKYLGLELSREETLERLEELLGLERLA